MIYNAPQWSPASAQLTHGFPRRLIAESHGGFLPGNITVAAKASNLTLRRLAVCDVACLISNAATVGAGLSKARLINLRYAAIRYHRVSSCPQYLASAMVEFGVNFATFEALSCSALDALHGSLTQAWKEGHSSDDSDSDAEQPLIPCTFPANVMQEIGKSTAEAGGSTSDAVDGTDGESHAALVKLLSRFSTRPADSESSESSEDELEATGQQKQSAEAGRAPSGKRKRKRASAGGSSKARRQAEPSDSVPSSNTGEVFQKTLTHITATQVKTSPKISLLNLSSKNSHLSTPTDKIET